MDTYKVLVKFGDDGIVNAVALHVSFAEASTISAAHKSQTRYIINEATDAVEATYRPIKGN